MLAAAEVRRCTARIGTAEGAPMPSLSPAPPASRCRQAVPRRCHRGLIPAAVADDGDCNRDPVRGAQCRRLGWPPFRRAADSAAPEPKFSGRMSAPMASATRAAASFTASPPRCA